MSTQPSEPPEELKCIKPFLRRGHQMEKLDPVVTYYCMLYSVQLALDKKLHVASPECTAFVTNLMENLELRKQQLAGNDLVEDDLAAQAYVENFATKVFNNGSKAIEARAATKKTVDALEAASVFFELLKTFNSNLDPEILQKIKYSKYHAARLMRAMREGKDLNPPPTPTASTPPPAPTIEEIPDETEGLVSPPQGTSYPPPQDTSYHLHSTQDFAAAPDVNHIPSAPPEQENDQSASATLPDGYFPPVPTLHDETPPVVDLTDTGAPDSYTEPSFPPTPPTAPAVDPSQNTSQYASTFPEQPSAFHNSQQYIPSPEPASVPRPTVSEQDIARAQKCARWAISALEFEDVDNAILQLRNGLAALGAS